MNIKYILAGLFIIIIIISIFYYINYKTDDVSHEEENKPKIVDDIGDIRKLIDSVDFDKYNTGYNQF